MLFISSEQNPLRKKTTRRLVVVTNWNNIFVPAINVF